MEKISRYLEQHEAPLSRKTIETAGLGKSGKWVRVALDALIAEGYVQEHRGPRNARLNTLIQPFRQSTSSSSSHPVPPRPDEDDPTSSSSSPPYRADELRDEDDVDDIDPDEVERLRDKHADIAEARAHVPLEAAFRQDEVRESEDNW